MRRAAAAALFVAAIALLGAARATAADDGWTIISFDAQIRIQTDGRLLITETIDVDFAQLERHGIFREIPVRYDWPRDRTKVRVYELQVQSVTDAQRRRVRYETSGHGANVQIKIGDPDHTVTGKQTYVIAYLVKGALNTFSDHDELFWNVTGSEWPVPILRSSATVSAPGPLTQTACFAGPRGSTAGCQVQPLTNGATYSNPRAVTPGDDFTIVAGLRKGVVSEPVPILTDRPREIEDYFDITPLWLALAVFVVLAGLALVLWRWYTAGRDQPEHETIVPEYEPPEKLRPAEVGLLMDERADPLDVTATIVDLAVRGYLEIAEVPKEGLFGSRDWSLTRKKGSDAQLRDYERTILDGLFSYGSGGQVKLSELKRHFYKTLNEAESELYDESVTSRWFPADPSRVRLTYAALGVALIVVAGIVTFALGMFAGGGIVGLATAVPAIAVIVVSPIMPRKTQSGAELHRRALGFERYMQVAETDRQKFAEREHIFAEYLPYAIVFRCVDQWAKAFEGLDLKEATSGWYVGNNLASFSAADMSRDLSSFSSQISSAIASTPGGSGSSGFSGGSSGGGGGGGGGGSW